MSEEFCPGSGREMNNRHRYTKPYKENILLGYQVPRLMKHCIFCDIERVLPFESYLFIKIRHIDPVDMSQIDDLLRKRGEDIEAIILEELRKRKIYPMLIKIDSNLINRRLKE